MDMDLDIAGRAAKSESYPVGTMVAMTPCFTPRNTVQTC
jgi:hypothetical protein